MATSVYLTNRQPLSFNLLNYWKVVTDKPLPFGLKVYQWQPFDDQGQGLYVCQIDRTNHGSYDIYYGDIILVHHSLYISVPASRHQSLFLLTHVIDEFKC